MKKINNTLKEPKLEYNEYLKALGEYDKLRKLEIKKNNMTRYRIKKVGRVGENNSYFGDTQKYFEGFAMYPPTIGERFVLWYNKLGGGVVIDTSPVLKIEEGEIHTMYSIYEIEEI